MKKNALKLLTFVMVVAGACTMLSLTAAENTAPQHPLKIGIVDFRYCVENSKLGKQEQAAFEAMKKKMEAVLDEKEKELNDLAEKLNDPDQLDLMSPEAETELKRKFRGQNQEISQLQSQCYQSLNQTNMKVIQDLAESIGEASDRLAKEENYDILSNSESIFSYNDDLDVSKKIVIKMDQIFDKTSSKPAAIPSNTP